MKRPEGAERAGGPQRPEQQFCGAIELKPLQRDLGWRLKRPEEVREAAPKGSESLPTELTDIIQTEEGGGGVRSGQRAGGP